MGIATIDTKGEHFNGSKEEQIYWSNEAERLGNAIQIMQNLTCSGLAVEERDRLLTLYRTKKTQAENNYESSCWEAEERRHANMD